MNSTTLLALLCATLLVRTGTAQLTEGTFVPGEVIVSPKHKADSADLVAFAAAMGYSLKATDPISQTLLLSVPEGGEAEAIRLLQLQPKARYAERNGIGSGAQIPNDPAFVLQWHLKNTGQSGGRVGADIEAELAWDLTTGSRAITVAVLDTGIDFGHPAFRGRIDPNGFDFVNSDNDPETDHPHGTQVSAVLMANANDGSGVCGVDWNCRVLPLKVLNAQNNGTSFNLAAALNYAANQPQVQVISMSLVNYPAQQTLALALDNCRGAGKILIACAGNNGPGNADVSWPGAAPQTISIGATNRNDQRAGFSGTGMALDFVAPGTQIVTAVDGNRNGATTSVSGCSFATPIAAGITTLLLAWAREAGLPALTQEEVYEALRLGAEDRIGGAGDLPGYDVEYGHGRLNAYRSLQSVSLLGACAIGNVGGMNPTPVLRIGGSVFDARTKEASVGFREQFAIQLERPLGLDPQVPAHFVLFATPNIPTTSMTTGWPGIGTLCFPPPGLLPQPSSFALLSSLPWPEVLLQVNCAPMVWPAGPAPQVPFTLTLQGLILDETPATARVTNAVVLSVEAMAAPLIANLRPRVATAGQVVQVLGQNFRAQMSLELMGQPLVPNSIVSDRIEFTMPAGIGCDALLIVRLADGQSDAATLNATPSVAISGSNPPTIGANGGLLTLTGSQLATPVTASIGGNPVMIVLQNDERLSLQIPPLPSGQAQLLLDNGLGCSTTVALTILP